jgi:F0F1-type ATP synthase assembly protein I
MADEKRDQPRADKTHAEAEYDRLMHRRKGISGSEFAGVGLQFAVTIVVFALLGIWLDKRWHTSPWLVIVGVFFGATAGFWTMYRQMVKKQR